MLTLLTLFSLAAFECGDMSPAFLGEIPSEAQLETGAALPDVGYLDLNGSLCARVTLDNRSGLSKLVVKDGNSKITCIEVQSPLVDGELVTRHFDEKGALLFSRIVTMENGGGIVESIKYVLPGGAKAEYCDLRDSMSPIASREAFDIECATLVKK